MTYGLSDSIQICDFKQIILGSLLIRILYEITYRFFTNMLLPAICILNDKWALEVRP